MLVTDAQEKIHEILSNTSEFCNLGDKDIVSSAQRKLSRIKEDARKDPTYTKEFELQDDEDERKWKKELAFMNAERKRQEKLANKKRYEKANGTGTPEILEPVLRTDPACSLHCDEDCSGDDEETLSDHTESRVDARLDEIDEIQAVNGLLSLLEAKKGSARPAKRKRETKTKTKTKKAGATHGAKKDEASLSEGSRDRGALKVKVLRANDASDLGDDGKSRDVMKAKTELPRAECPPEHDHEGDGVGGATSPFPFLFSGSDASVDDEKRSRREATIPIRYRR